MAKIKLLNHIACDVASEHDINSASVVEVATKDCFALLQEMALSANKKTYLDVNFLESRQPPKLEFEYSITSR